MTDPRDPQPLTAEEVRTVVALIERGADEVGWASQSTAGWTARVRALLDAARSTDGLREARPALVEELRHALAAEAGFTTTTERLDAIVGRLMALASPEPAGPAHPEAFCQRCGRPNPAWSAPDDLWNEVMGSPNGIVCPSCFAAAADPSLIWRFAPVSPEPAPLACTCGPWTVEGDPMFRTARGSWHKGSCPLHLSPEPAPLDRGRLASCTHRDRSGNPAHVPVCPEAPWNLPTNDAGERLRYHGDGGDCAACDWGLAAHECPAGPKEDRDDRTA